MDERHANEALSLVLTDFEYPDDIRMRQPGGSLAFDLESKDGNGRVLLRVQQHLQRYHAFGGDLARPVDHSHAAAAELFDQFVTGKYPGRKGKFRRFLVQTQPQQASRAMARDDIGAEAASADDAFGALRSRAHGIFASVGDAIR